jgi:hypothetical protein
VGKTIFAALIASVLASIATVIVMEALRAERSAADAQARELETQTQKIERDRLVQRLADVERRVAAPARAERRAEPAASVDPAPAASPAAPAPLAADGTPYVSRAQMEAFARSLGARVGGVAEAPAEVKPVEKKTLEEIAREQGLSAGEEANLRNILRESEEELIHCLFGTKTIEEVKADFLAAKADPEKQSELMQSAIQNALQNVGKLMTAEKRTKKRVNEVLGEERGKKFMDAPRKSVIAPDMEEFFKDFGD